jgi:hypothetical protein
VVLKKQLSTCRRLKLELYLSPCKKINSKCIKYLNIRPKTLKLQRENIGETHRHRELFSEQDYNCPENLTKNVK